jgi:membrane-bound ClpP family serine protease
MMRFGKAKKNFAFLHFFTTTTEEAVLVVIMLVILPRLGVVIPFWLVGIFIFVWAAWSYLAYRLSVNTINKIPVVGAEALVGVRCRTTTPLAPMGYVKVGSELWQAYLLDGEINSDVEVIIIEVKGLTLLVKKTSDVCGNALNLS